MNVNWDNVTFSILAGVVLAGLFFIFFGGILLEVYLLVNHLWVLAGIIAFVWVSFMFAISIYVDIETKQSKRK